MATRDNPKVSIITCTKNREKYIELNINSVKMQNYSNYEHIFIDAFSTDRTVDIIKQYIDENKDKNIKLYQYPPKGIANAMNLGVQHSSGEILHFLHSDDFYLTNNVLTLVTNYFANNPNKDWLTGNMVLAINDRMFSIPVHKLLKKYLKALTMVNFISHENTFVTKEFFQKYGPFEEKHKAVVEYALWLRAVKENPPLVVDEDFTVFIMHSDSMSSNPTRFPLLCREAVNCWKLARSIPLVGDPSESPILRGLAKILKETNGNLATKEN